MFVISGNVLENFENVGEEFLKKFAGNLRKILKFIRNFLKLLGNLSAILKNCFKVLGQFLNNQ